MARLGKWFVVLLIAITLNYSDNINCPGDPDWHFWNGHCYFWSTSLTANWEKAQKICRAYRSTELLYLNDVTEKNWLSTEASGVYWTGLNDKASESNFQWTTNASLSASLMLFLKNDLVNGDLKDCVQFNTRTGLLTDNYCSVEQPFICKSNRFMDWFLKEERTGLIYKPPYAYPSKMTLAEAKIACLQQGTACTAVLETVVPNTFYLLDSSAKITFNPYSTIYIPSGFPGPKCGMEDQSCDCTGIVRTSFTEVCGISVKACKNYCATKKDGTDCSKCVPVCPDNADEILRKDEASIVMLAKGRIFGGATILTVNDQAYLNGFQVFYKKN